MDAFIADLLAMELRDREASVVDMRDTDDGDTRVVQLGLYSDVQDLSDDQYRIQGIFQDLADHQYRIHGSFQDLSGD